MITAALLLALGYLHYAPGAAYSLSAEHYRAWAFPAFRYSDLIWLYLRDGLDRRPMPYLDYPLEYPPLTGLISWILSRTTDLPAYFALAYAVLAAGALLTVWALQRLDGANAWLFALSPALFFYTGHQWDMAAISAAALGLLALQRGRDGWGVVALVAATSLKLFPVVFIAAAIVERVRNRRFRSAAALALAFAAGTAAVNLPVALANVDGWSYFYRWNRDRLADSGIWVLFRDQPTADLTRWSLVAVVVGGAALTVLALRSRGPLVLPLGATYLLWWLLVNKTFTTHLMLWAILSLALLSAPWWLLGLATAVDLAGFQLGNYLNLYNVPEFRHAPLIRKAVENIYDPMQIARSAVLLTTSLWGLHVLWRGNSLTSESTPKPMTSRLTSPPALVPRQDPPASLPAPTNRLATGLGVTIIFALSAVVMTWPYARHLSDATIVGFDPYLQIWLSAWIQHALITNPLGLFDANIFYPFAQSLAYTDANVPGAIVAAPLRFVTGDPVLTNSLLVLAAFVLAAGGVYALIVYLTGNRGAGIVAGLAYAFLPYRMVHLWHLNWLEGGLLPWVVLALLRLLARPTVPRGVAFGLLAATQILISVYFALQIALLAGLVVAARIISDRQRPSAALVRGLAAATFTAALLVIPLYAPYLNVRDEQGLERTVADAEQYKALSESYLQLAPWDLPNAIQSRLGIRSGPNESLTEVGQAQHADGHRHGEIVVEDALFPGMVALVFAVVGLVAWRSEQWLVAALATTGMIAFVLSLGPTFGARHGNGPSLPYDWFFDHAPLFRAMRVPARLGGLVDLVLVLLAGLGIAAAWRWLKSAPRHLPIVATAGSGAVATAALSALVIAELWTGAAPIELVDRGPEARAAADWLATQPAGPVMIFPAESVFADPAAASVRRHDGETMFWSTLHWKPIVNGNSGFIPRAYSDFIERFVGPVPRPDGSTTGRISHLTAETARLLSQIGVRYLVFNRAQYRAEDWPAVAAELDLLSEAGVLSPAGNHGNATIYLLNPVLPAVEEPLVKLFAPTLLGPGEGWAPWLGVESLSGDPAVLSLTRPARLETAWYDNAGSLLRRDTRRIPLPVVMDEPWLLCGASECLTTRPFDDLGHLPPPDSDGAWRPTEAGHYIVRLRLSGDHEVDCRVDLDVVADDAEVWERSRNDAYRWAECRSEAANPVNAPGAVPFDLNPPSITLRANSAVVDIALTTRHEEQLRGWFVLAPPGIAEPWNNAVYTASVQQKLALLNQRASFEWDAPIGSTAPPGIYDLTFWFHRLGLTGWEHAAGGDVGLAPIVVDQDHTLRWAGPLRARLAEAAAPVLPGKSARFALEIDGMSNQMQCDARWSLFSDTTPVATGDAATCEQPEILIPDSVVPGVYRLQIDILAVRDGEARLSDAVTVPVTVIESAPPGSPE